MEFKVSTHAERLEERQKEHLNDSDGTVEDEVSYCCFFILLLI